MIQILAATTFAARCFIFFVVFQVEALGVPLTEAGFRLALAQGAGVVGRTTGVGLGVGVGVGLGCDTQAAKARSPTGAMRLKFMGG